jgi:hypothetical protein
MTAVVRGGAFVPTVNSQFAEGDQVVLTISGMPMERAPTTDLTERRRILREIVASLALDPLPAEAPRFTRDEFPARG